MKNTSPRLMSQRLYTDYPWPVWAIGWIAMLKAFVWLGSEPASLPDNQLVLMGYKYILFMLPFLICGIGAWNMKKWAAWGLIFLAAADLLFYLVSPADQASLALNRTSSVAYTFSMTVFVINGPPTSVAMLFLAPSLLRHVKPSSRAPATG